MRVETPQILWHNDNEGNGKPAPLYSVSLLPLPPPISTSTSSNQSDSENRNRNSYNGNGNGTCTGNGNGNGSNNDNIHILATSGNSNEVHIWKVAFPLISPTPTQTQAQTQTQAESTATTEEATSSPSPPLPVPLPPTSTSASTSPLQSPSPSQGRAKRQKILSRQTSSIQHALTLSRHTDRSINATAFSPCGTHLATAGDGGVLVIHSVPFHVRRSRSQLHMQAVPISAAVRKFWTKELSSEKELVSRTVSTHADDISDLSWSGCGRRVILGSLDHAVFVFEESMSAPVSSSSLPSSSSTGNGVLSNMDVGGNGYSVNSQRVEGSNASSSSPMAVDDDNLNTHVNVNTININAATSSIPTSTCSESKWTCVWRNTKEHTHYVQGVAFDPLGVYLASQGSDRTVRVWQRKRGAGAASLGGRGKACQNGNGNGGNSSGNSSGSLNGNGNGNDGVAKKKKVLAVMDSNANAKVCSVGNSTNVANGVGVGAAVTAINRPASNNQRPTGKFEVSSKAKTLKYRSSCSDSRSSNNNNNNANENKPAVKGNENNANDSDKNTQNDGAATITTTAKKRHLFADESSVESFFRRLAWTKDGAFLITPASLFHSNKGPTFATYLFARHQYDRPYKVLSGLEKPSVVVRPNPTLFQLPRDVQSGSKENKKVPPPQSVLSRSPSPSSNVHNLNDTIPYRSIFAVLTIDSILIYDTYHSRPLCIVRGLHYAGLTDCTWSPDGRNLIVCSTDGYISIVSFAKGELGEEYVNLDAVVSTSATDAVATNSTGGTMSRNTPLSSSPTLSSTSRNVMTEAEVRTVLQSQNRNLPSCPPSSVLPLCEPGQSATLVAPPSKKARLSYNGENESLLVAKDMNVMKAQTKVEGAEEKKGQGSTSSVSMETEVVGAVTNLTIDGKLQREVNHMRQIC